jgi:hypothetical protein
MIEVGSYCCSFVDSPLPSSKTKPSCFAAPFRFLGFGIGVMNWRACDFRESSVLVVLSHQVPNALLGNYREDLELGGQKKGWTSSTPIYGRGD